MPEIGDTQSKWRIYAPSGQLTAIGASKEEALGKYVADKTFERMVGLYNRQPRLSSRTSQSMAEQAYSTPVPLAYVASRLAGITKETTVLEPTAGNGALLIEASPSKAQVNELNPERAANLMSQGFRVSQADAMETTLRHAGYPVDVVIANPPFGAVRVNGDSKVFEVNGLRTTAIDHAISFKALQHMKDDGRAVLIIGGVKAESDKERADGYSGSQKRKFFHKLYNSYNVVQHFTVQGDLYQRQGAAWPVDVIVIDGKGKSSLSLPAAKVPPLVRTWEELKGYLDDERGGALPRPGGEQIPSAPQGGAGSEGGNRPGSEESRPGGPAGDETAPSGQPETSSVPADQPESEPSDGRPLEGDQGEGALGSGADAAGTDQRPSAKQRGQRVTEANATGQVPYRPYSEKGEPLNTLVPAALGASMDNALADIERRHGDIDTYVARELGYETDGDGMFFLNEKGEKERPFSAEQTDAIAMAIDNVAKGAGFIIGDQTGIGKGRVVAGAIRFAHKKGMMPVFVTESPDLYGDMFRDMKDIGWRPGGREPNIFITNIDEMVPLDEEAVDWINDRNEARDNGQPEPPQRGRFTERQSAKVTEKRMQDILGGSFKPDATFTTYNQMNSVKGAETARRAFMDRLSGKAFLIMDESHNAGGQGDVANQRKPAKKDGKEPPPPRSQKFREWLSRAKAVMYSSATYAKNPNVMDLYSRTDMAKAVSSPDELPG
jgi:predicted RNA methylase